jgi:hydroxymethylpyrimidine/phosphomethylpyrimidine kinase
MSMPDADFTDDQPVALTIAGSDCSSGAGLQADLKTFSAFNVYGLTAITCAVAETPRTVSSMEALTPGFLADQVRLLCQNFPVAAIKTGMLFSAPHVKALAQVLDELAYSGHLVVDPVMIATSGAALIEDDAIFALESLLLPRATVVTPNMDEAAALLGRPIDLASDLEAAAIDLQAKYGAPALVKGGHLPEGSPILTDVLCLSPDDIHHFEGPRFEGVPTHGTGCTYASAIAARLALGSPLPQAVQEAHHYVASTIQQSFRWHLPQGPLHALNHSFS